MWQDIVGLFTEMGPIPAVLLTVGIIFCIIEMFQPGVGFFGISGSIAILAGIVLRFIYGFNLAQLFVLVLIIAVILAIAGILIVRSAKKGVLSRSAFVNINTAVPVNFNNKELEKHIGKTGVTTTECKPIGKAEIDGCEYEVISQGEFIIKGMPVEVIQINSNNLVVKVKEGEEN